MILPAVWPFHKSACVVAAKAGVLPYVPPVAADQAVSRPGTVEGESTFSNAFQPRCPFALHLYCAQLVRTRNDFWIPPFDWRPTRLIQCVPGTADAGIVTL